MQQASRTQDGVAYTFETLRQSENPNLLWIVFVNGLGLDQLFWNASILKLRDGLKNTEQTVCTTTYDRLGQGLSAPESGSPPKHDLTYSIQELQKVIKHVQATNLANLSSKPLQMIMVAHSLGVPLLRLFLADDGSKWPVVGVVLIDSNMANIDMCQLLPDPSSPDFDSSKLPPDTDTAALEWSRNNYRRMFSPDAQNKENLDRTTLPGLLPFSDRPPLPLQMNGEKMQLTVVAHDPETFAEESLKISTLGLTRQYVEPVWHQYNLGLLRLTGDNELNGADIVVANGSGHFVQRDNPGVVAETMIRMIEKIVW